MSKYPIVIATSDNYINALKPFVFLMNKYWDYPPELIVFGFTPPPNDFHLECDWRFISIGEQEHFPIQRWSDAIIAGLETIEEEVFIFMLEDMWITRPVHERVVNMAYDYMLQFEYVARFDLTGDRWNAFDSQGNRPPFYGKLGHVNLVFSLPNSQYHLSTMPAFWRKKHLLRALIPGETPWQVELQGTPRLSMMDDVVVVGTDDWPLRNTLAFRGGDSSKLLLGEVDPEDVKMMRELGLMEGLE